MANVNKLIDWLEASYENRLMLVQLWEGAVRAQESEVLADAEERLLAQAEEEADDERIEGADDNDNHGTEH